jgi:hypothetical protein
MLIIIILVAVIILGAVLNLLDRWHESIVGMLSVVLATGILLGCTIVIMTVQIPAENDYQKMLYEKEVLEYRIENEENNIVGNELLYNDIVEFNNALRDEKYYADNLWVNWFHNAKIAEIDYIEIPGYNNE